MFSMPARRISRWYRGSMRRSATSSHFISGFLPASDIGPEYLGINGAKSIARSSLMRASPAFSARPLPPRSLKLAARAFWRRARIALDELGRGGEASCADLPPSRLRRASRHGVVLAAVELAAGGFLAEFL